MFLLALFACTILPQEGLYAVEVTDLSSNPACDDWGVDVGALSEINATEITVAEDGESMELDAYLECDLFGLDFECFLEESESVPRSDADVVTTHQVDGTWTSSYTFEATWALSVACVGSDCSDIDPCEIDFAWDGYLY